MHARTFSGVKSVHFAHGPTRQFGNAQVLAVCANLVRVQGKRAQQVCVCMHASARTHAHARQRGAGLQHVLDSEGPVRTPALAHAHAHTRNACAHMHNAQAHGMHACTINRHTARTPARTHARPPARTHARPHARTHVHRGWLSLRTTTIYTTRATSVRACVRACVRHACGTRARACMCARRPHRYGRCSCALTRPGATHMHTRLCTHLHLRARLHLHLYARARACTHTGYASAGGRLPWAVAYRAAVPYQRARRRLGCILERFPL